ncbi:rCG35402 [Rattus norvegicus]|uniref:RCG35402 n=1 Tax=Rattus norvegicus TaxID=10116 RepID=A6HGC0_RAT|nr:rCG35402 [Rattus norvegicus]
MHCVGAKAILIVADIFRSQHSGGRGRRIKSSRPFSATSQV